MPEEKFLQELTDWLKLVSTPEWKAFTALLKAHKEWLQSQVNIQLKMHQDRLAGEFRARLEEVDLIFRKVEERIKHLRGGEVKNGR